jgi:hypothetical protein
MRILRTRAPALLLLLGLSACHARARAPMHGDAGLAGCGVPARLGAAMAAELAQGRVPEASPLGKCVANAARQGNITAAMLLADTYRAAMAPGGSAAPGLDLFGRHIGWLHMATDQGDPGAQSLLAQETDGPASIAMPDSTLTWYQTAAENGNRQALAAIGAAYRGGRIADERLYDLRNWLAAQTNPTPADRAMTRLLAGARAAGR